MAKDENKHFFDDLKRLINNPKHSDIKFIVGDARDVVYGHRCLLACRCAAFDALLVQGPSGVDELYLPEVSIDVFLLIVEFLYTNTCNMKKCSQMLMDTMIAASEYGIDDLIKLCKDHMKTTAQLETACDYMQIAVTFDLDDLKKTILTIFERNFEKIIKFKKFVELSQEVLQYVLGSQKLNINEYDLIIAVCDWAVGNSVVLGRPSVEVISPLINLLHISSLSQQDLSKLEDYNQRHTVIPVESISQGWRSHAMNANGKETTSTKARTKQSLSKS